VALVEGKPPVSEYCYCQHAGKNAMRELMLEKLTEYARGAVIAITVICPSVFSTSSSLKGHAVY
jgi:hypothetical protein